MNLSERRVRETVDVASGLLVALQRELFDTGLLETAHAVNEASKKLGWEAERLLLKARAEASPKRRKKA